jgi:hypothetical protein
VKVAVGDFLLFRSGIYHPNTTYTVSGSCCRCVCTNRQSTQIHNGELDLLRHKAGRLESALKIGSIYREDFAPVFAPPPQDRSDLKAIGCSCDDHVPV